MSIHNVGTNSSSRYTPLYRNSSVSMRVSCTTNDMGQALGFLAHHLFPNQPNIVVTKPTLHFLSTWPICGTFLGLGGGGHCWSITMIAWESTDVSPALGFARYLICLLSVRLALSKLWIIQRDYSLKHTCELVKCSVDDPESDQVNTSHKTYHFDALAWATRTAHPAASCHQAI